jgi:adenine-specific DNA-methyltransferase
MAKTPVTKKTSRDRFLNLLRNVLKLDLAELDFGIYRSLNYRRAEIDDFLSDRLPKLMEAVLTGESEARLEQAKTDLASLKDELERSASGLGLREAFPAGELDERLRSSPKGEEYSRVETG